jgi:hypothetical protein
MSPKLSITRQKISHCMDPIVYPVKAGTISPHV